jgi:HK97 family phage portal protein
VLDGKTEHGPADILHVKGLSLDGVVGISPVAHCRVALGLNEDLRESSRQYFRKGSRPSGILTVPPEHQMNPDFVETVKKAWEVEHAGAENMHKIVIVGGGAQFTPVSFNAGDSQFLEQRELSAREVARIFRVPAWAIDGATGDSLTYANVQEQARALVMYSLRPWLVRIERALSNDADLCPGVTYVEFDLDGLLRADAATRADVYTKALNAETGWMTREEVRELENLNPEGGPNA